MIQLQSTQEQGGLGQRLIANTLFNVLGQLYVVVLGLAVIPYVAHRLGAGLYGLAAVVAALGGFTGFLNLGIGTSLSKYVSELYWQGRFGEIRSLFCTAVTISVLAGAGACVLLVLFRGPLAAGLVHGDRSATAYADFAVFVTAFGVMMSLALDPLSALPAALQRFDVSNLITVLFCTIRNFGVVAALALGFFFKGVLLVYLLATLFSVLGYAHYARRLVPGLTLRPGIDWDDLKRLIRYAAPVLAASVGTLVIYRFDRVVVAYFLPIAAVAFYVIPYSLASRTWTGVGNITSVIFPSASELSSMQAHGKVRELYVRATKMVLLAGIPVTVVLLALPSEILRYWVGPEYASRGALALQLLAAGFFFNILTHVPYVVAQGIGRPWISAKYSLIGGALNLALFLLLIPAYGIAGAAAGFLVGQVVVSPLFVGEVNRALGVPLKRLAAEAYLRPLACGAVAWTLLRALGPRMDSLLSVIFYVGLVLSAYGFLALVGAIERRERVDIYNQLVRTLRLSSGGAHA